MATHNLVEAEEKVLEEFTSPSNIPRNVAFEDYIYYAAEQRRQELGTGRTDGQESPAGSGSDTKGRSHFGKPKAGIADVKVKDVNDEMTQEQQERAQASRALRTAGYMQIFYLITTDILGPFNAPFAISQVGWVPGIILYFIMGVMALYGGLLLMSLFLRLDSCRYPCRSYADVAERVFGRWAKHGCAILEGLQLIVNVGSICLSNGQSLSQMTKGRLCFSVCIVVWALLGMIIGQIRTLKSYGWLANSAVWINLLIIFTSMGFVAHSPPNFEAAAKSLGVDPTQPVKTVSFNTDLPLYLQVNGIMNMVFAYGGAMIFFEMMAEMRRPMDFWKGMIMAQALIFTCYVMYGAFVYAFQGQFTLPLAYQGVSRFDWQTVGNAFALVSGIIAAGLYGNIGIKVVYNHIIVDIFDGPALISKKGRIFWTLLVLGYWVLAFIIGSAIPQIQTITGLIAAVAIMQFTYTFPPLFRFWYDMKSDAMIADTGEYIPGRQFKTPIDSWRHFSRWRRALMAGAWYRPVWKIFNLLISLASLAMACLGMWGAGTSIKATFQNAGAATSFGCTSPVA